jgi:tRNA-dihydrouridine synthase
MATSRGISISTHEEHPVALQLGGSEPADLASLRQAGRAMGL